MSIPIPQTQRELLEHGQSGNAALFFSRMTEYEKEGGKTAKDAIVKLGDEMGKRFPAAKTALAAIHTRQASFVGAAVQHAEVTGNGLALEIRATLTAPFVSGLGSGHPTETGLILDRNSGLPYIPASSIKGVLRLACALYIAETEPDKVLKAEEKPTSQMDKNSEPQWAIRDDHPLLRRYFGDTDTSKANSIRGQLVFLDAFPAEVSSRLLKADIMNPHFVKYYSGEQGPLETESPIPVKFLAVAPETEFVFRCFTLPLPERKPDDKDATVFRPFDEEDEKTVISLFERAFNQLGFGGKTSIGYGRFTVRDEDIKYTVTLREEFIKEQQKKQKDEEGKKYPWRFLLTGIEQVEWGVLRQKYLDNTALQKYQNNPEVGAKVRDAAMQLRKSQRKNWKEERDTFLKAWLEPSGIVWQPENDAPESLGTSTQPDEGVKTSPSELEQRIRSFKDYGVYVNAAKAGELKITALSLSEALALQDRFRDWGIDTAKNDEKKKLWKELQKLIKKPKQ